LESRKKKTRPRGRRGSLAAEHPSRGEKAHSKVLWRGGKGEEGGHLRNWGVAKGQIGKRTEEKKKYISRATKNLQRKNSERKEQKAKFGGEYGAIETMTRLWTKKRVAGSVWCYDANGKERPCRTARGRNTGD